MYGSREMPQWIGNAATVAAPLVALVALIVSIWAARRAARKREFEILLERIDREAAKREERIDREAAKREAETKAVIEGIEREAAERETEAKAFIERIEREAAKREEGIDREAAKREAETKAFIERIEREAAKREERIDREAAKREERIRELMDRSDRKFESLQRRTDELYRQSAEVTSRVAHNEAVLATAVESTPARGETEAVAAQDVSVGRPRE